MFSCCSSCENLNIDASIIPVGFIMKKQSALQNKSKSNNILTFLLKKLKFLGFHTVVLVKTFQLKYQTITTVGRY